MPTLLLSDDSLTVQRLIAMTFSEQDIDVVSVPDGEEAIARITAQRPDIVLASIGTRKRSGYEVAAHVKSTPHLASIPVLLLAAAFEPVDQVRAAQVRCDGVLIKPLEPQQLIARVRQLLADSGQLWPHQAAPAPPDELPRSGSGTGGVDDYFARLDVAFSRRPVPRPAPRSDDVGTVPTVDSVLTPAEPTVRDVPVSVAAEPVVTDALVDEVTRRVVERLGTGAVRDLVADVVAEVSERLIREEITRIRNKA
jgi:CheY-like chemotaxis protein